MIGTQAWYRSRGFVYGSAARVVGERCCRRRSGTVRSRGAAASENAGMSNDKAGENPARRKPKVSWGR
jgi:hypothetical protein